MKKLLSFLTISVFCSVILVAQPAGKVMFGGTFGFSSTKRTGIGVSEKNSLLVLGPVIGYQATDQVALGVGVNYLQTKTPTTEEKALQVNPFLRIHYPITETVNYFVEPNLEVNFSFGDSPKAYDFSGGINVGIYDMIAPSVSLELKMAGITYSYYKPVDSNNKTTGISFIWNNANPTLGLVFYF